MKPPPWTGNRNGIELQEPPICSYCVEDCAAMTRDGAHDYRPPNLLVRIPTAERLKAVTESLESLIRSIRANPTDNMPVIKGLGKRQIWAKEENPVRER